MKRYLLFAVATGFLVGGGVGGAVGHREGYYAGRVAVMEEYPDMTGVVKALREQASSDVRVGMTMAEVDVIVNRENYRFDRDGSDVNLRRWRKSWRHGVQYVNVRFKDDNVIDVSNLWID